MQLYKKIIFLSILLTFLTACNKKDVLDIALLKDSTQVSYTVEYIEKLLFETDTIKTKYNVTLIKNNLDSLYGYDFKINNEKFLFYHKNNKSYSFNKKLNVYSVVKKRNENFIEFLFPLIKIQNKDSISIKSKNSSNYTFSSKFSNKGSFKNITREFIVTKKENNLISNSLYLDFQNTNQFTKSIYNNININFKLNLNKELDSLLLICKPIKKKISKINPITTEDLNKINGTLLKSKNLVTLKDFNQDLILLDFWYMACYPCIKSFPTLNSIRDKYMSNSFKIIGINSIDNKLKNLKQLDAFILKNNIKNPVILNNNRLENISNYPTVILLDKKRDIIYSHVGYNEENENRLLKFLEKKFKKNE